MSRNIDIGGRQGRGNPKLGLGEDGTLIDLDLTKPAERTHSVWGDLATGAGLLAPDSYSEPETRDLEPGELAPITRAERLLVWLCMALGVAGIGSLVVSCAA